MNINFIKYFSINLFFSVIVVVFCIFYIIKNNIDFGLEFTGGLELELEYTDKVKLSDIRYLFNDFKDVTIKYYGSKKHLQIKIKKSDKNKKDIIVLIKKLLDDGAKVLKIDYIGAEVTSNVINNSIKALLLSVLLMFIYLTFRFDYILALSAIIVLVHDIIIVIGLLLFFEFEFNLSVMAALFAVFGYVVNDTIIIFDRIREARSVYNINDNAEMINAAINNTVVRTLITSLSTLFVVTIIFIFGGEYLWGFAFTLFFGIIIGTYSSIYVAPAPMLFFNRVNKQ